MIYNGQPPTIISLTDINIGLVTYARGGSRNATDGVLMPRLRFAKQNGVPRDIVMALSRMLPGQSHFCFLMRYYDRGLTPFFTLQHVCT